LVFATAFDPGAITVADAFAEYDKLHSAGCPIARSERHGGFWLVVGAEAARAVLSDYERFRSGDGVMFPDPGLPKNPPIEYDPPEHRTLRKVFSDALSTTKVRAAEEQIRGRIDRLIDNFGRRGHADLKSEFAGPLTVQTIADQVGVPEVRIQDMERVAHELLQALENGEGPGSKAFGEFGSFAMELIAMRRNNPCDDTLTVIATAESDGELLSPEQAISYFTGFLIAGHDTTRASLCRLLYEVGTDDALRARLIEGPDVIGRVVEESLRLRPPFHFFRRTVAETTELNGVTLAKGDAVLVSFAAANRDPKVYECPARFDPDRSQLRHMTFGHGIHLCAGLTLARTQLRLAMTRVLERIPDYRPVEHEALCMKLGVVDSMSDLPVSFTPET
jgi:cytochrome P450